jgi:hypothetical protein
MSRAVVVACAASAGAHAGLVPEHLGEAPQLGFAFGAAVVLLLATAIALAIRPDSVRASQGAVLLLAALIVSYAASRTTGIPLLQPRPEALDAVGLATKLVEGLGLVFALCLSQPAGARRLPAAQEVAR